MLKQDLTRTELEDLHSVLRRAAERAERANDERLAAKLSEEVLVLAEELARAS